MMQRTSASSIFWPADDGDSPSSSPVQPIIDAGKQKRSSSTVETAERPSSLAQRLPLGALLSRRLHSTLSPITTTPSPPPKVSPEKTGQVVDLDCRTGSASALFRSWRTSSGSSEAAMKVPDSRRSSVAAVVDSRHVDSYTPWHRSDDESQRRNSVQLYGTTRRISEPAASGMKKSPSASSLSALGRNADRRRPWISKYLQQFVETDHEEEKPTPRRRGSVATLIDSFEQCALQYGALERPPTAVPLGRRGRVAIHGSLTNLDSIDRTRGWFNNSEKAAGDVRSNGAPQSTHSDFTSTASSNQTEDPPRVQSYGECVKSWMMRNNCASVNQLTDTRSSSVGVIRGAPYGSLTNLDSVDRARRWSSGSEKATDDRSGREAPPSVRSDVTPTKTPALTSQPRPTFCGDYVETWKTRNNQAKVVDQQTNTRRYGVDVITPVALCQSSASFNPKQGPQVQPHHERRLSVLFGRGHINNTDSSDNTDCTLPTAAKSPGAVNQHVESGVREAGGGSSPWIREPTSDSFPTAGARSSSTSYWVEKSVPSFVAVEACGDFEPGFWPGGDTCSLRRTGSLVSDSNNTEDSGIATSEHTSSTADWSWSHHEAARDKGSWSRSKAGTWMTHRADDDDDESPSTTTDTALPLHTKLLGSEDDESRVNQSWRDELSDNISPAETSKPPPCAVVVGGHERSPTSQSTETASQHGRHPYQPPPAEYSHVVVVDSPGWSTCKEVDKPPNHHRQNSNSPLRSSLTVALSPVLSPPHDNHRLSMTSPDGDNFVDLPEQMRDDVTRHVILVELDKGVSGLGFCIKGGKQSPSGDQPVIVKRIFRCETSARKHLRVGDVILSANGKHLSEMTHYEAWNYLKHIPDGVIHLVIARS